MRRLVLSGAALLAGVVVVSGCQRPVGDLVDHLLIGEVMMHAEFSVNLRSLAMPGGRLSGTPNARRAERFVAGKLREYGLHNVHYEPFDMQCWIVRETKVTLLTDPPRVLEGALALGRTLSTPPGGVTAELVDLGEVEDEEDFTRRGADLAGKFVLLRDGGLRRRHKIRLARQHGAAGVIVMSAADRDPIIGSGHAEPRPEPVVTIAYDQALLDRLARGERPAVNIELTTENWDCRPNNVVAEIPGEGPHAHEVVIACAHLDSWHLGEGAIDNGNGSAALLETARALARVNWQPRRTVRFIWFMGEELDLVGSRAFVQAHLDELDDVVAVINLDMPGSPRKVGLMGHSEAVPFVRGVLEDLTGYELDTVPGKPVGDWSDHAPFMNRGVCTMWIGGELGPGVKHYHTAGDTYDIVDRRGTTPTSAVLAVLMRRLADAPERPTMRRDPAHG